MTLAEKYLDYTLEDDNTPYGGVSFHGETLKNFLEEVNMPLNSSMEDVNKALQECGIKPIIIPNEDKILPYLGARVKFLRDKMNNADYAFVQCVTDYLLKRVHKEKKILFEDYHINVRLTQDDSKYERIIGLMDFGDTLTFITCDVHKIHHQRTLKDFADDVVPHVLLNDIIYALITKKMM